MEKTTKVVLPVPKMDINAPIKVSIGEPGESTEYATGVTPKNRLLYVLGIAGFAVLSLLVCGILIFYVTGFRSISEQKVVKVVESQVEVSKTSTFERGSVTFEVLNGSGTPGAAKKAADSLQSLGYEVTGTGNTGQVTGNKLYLKANAEGYLGNIITDLAGFEVSTVSGELTEGTASARLIIGK